MSTCVSLNPFVDTEDGKEAEMHQKMQEMMESTKKEPNCLYYGFTVKEGTLSWHCREGYDSAEGVIAHLQNVGPILGEALKFSKLNAIEAHGPAAELEKLKEPMSTLPATFWTLEFEYRRADSSDSTRTEQCVSILPQFQIHEGKEAEFRQCCEEMVASTKEEPKCLYYGFTFCGSKAQCREGYEDAESALHHVDRVGPLLGKAMEIATLEKIEFHGPAAELEKMKGPLAHLPAVYYAQAYEYRK